MTQPTPTAPDDVVCPRCGCLDLPAYQGELPLCPHCGAVITPTADVPTDWLAQWPLARRSGLAQLFYAAVRRGVTDPAMMVEAVLGNLTQKLHWTADFDRRQFFAEVAQTIRHDRHAAQAYALAVLRTEQLPAAEKAALKAQKGKTFALAAMQGKPATERQGAMLRSLGHTGEAPSNRAEASALIDTLRRRTGGGHV